MTITKRFKESYYCRIEPAALVSVLMAAIFMFMYADQPIHHSGASVELPRGNNPVLQAGANREDAMFLAVMKDGVIYFRSEKIYNRQQLAAAIRVALQDKTVERKIYIKADARAKYGYVAEALDGVSDSGIEKIAFLVEKRKRASF